MRHCWACNTVGLVWSRTGDNALCAPTLGACAELEMTDRCGSRGLGVGGDMLGHMMCVGVGPFTQGGNCHGHRQALL